MDTATLLRYFPPKSPPTRPLLPALPRPPPAVLPFSSFRRHQPLILRATDGGGDSSGSDGPTVQAPPPITPPETVEIRFRRGSRRRRQQEQQAGDDGRPMRAQSREGAAAPPKKWDEMSLQEKAMELYVGEKGLLFWLNKFAYASIFIVIGAWILFRFVGPSLNLYQLDSPPLAPTSMFKG